jgi:beta-N-acetylhexosaminidase
MSESIAMISGCLGAELSSEETAFFRDRRPWGFILFARNLKETNQIADLTASFRDAVGRPNAPVLIDQEGGRVQRLRPPLAPNYPSGAALGAIYRQSPEAGRQAARMLSRLHAIDLRKLGINVDCLPVLDVPVEGANNVIGDRAYGFDPKTVTEMGREAALGLMDGGVLPVMKHMPGHGRGMADSHHHVPVVTASLDELKRHDFVPFAAMADLPLAMTGHVIFTAIDADRPATASPIVIEEIIRGYLKYDGLLMTDDLSMNALSGDMSRRARAIFDAGCDMALHCHGIMDEMIAVADQAPVLSGKPLQRGEAALARITAMDEHDEMALRTEFDGLLSAVA